MSPPASRARPTVLFVTCLVAASVAFVGPAVGTPQQQGNATDSLAVETPALAGENVTVTARTSFTPTDYDWYVAGGELRAQNGPVATITFAEAGNHTVVAVASDERSGEQAALSRTVHVRPDGFAGDVGRQDRLVTRQELATAAHAYDQGRMPLDALADLAQRYAAVP